MELVGTLPAVVVAAVVVCQLALAGHAAWLCANAARVAARAEAVGRDGRAAARSALPAYLERGLRVERTGAAGVRVRVAVPLVAGGMRGPLEVQASAALRGGG